MHSFTRPPSTTVTLIRSHHPMLFTGGNALHANVRRRGLFRHVDSRQSGLYARYCHHACFSFIAPNLHRLDKSYINFILLHAEIDVGDTSWMNVPASPTAIRSEEPSFGENNVMVVYIYNTRRCCVVKKMLGWSWNAACLSRNLIVDYFDYLHDVQVTTWETTTWKSRTTCSTSTPSPTRP